MRLIKQILKTEIFFKMSMGVLIFSSHPCMGHLRPHRVWTPDLEAH